MHPDLLDAIRAEELQVIRAERQRVYDNMVQVAETVTAQSVVAWDEIVVNMVQGELNRHWAQYLTENGRLIDALTESELQREVRQEAIGVASEFGKVRTLLDDRFQQLQSQKGRMAPKPSEINLPKFDGAYTAWVAWRAQFVNKVKDTALPADAKIDLLLSSLTGEARQCAGESERRDQVDFDRMWAKLDTTYDNRYQIVSQHINKLLDLPVTNSNPAQTMRLIIDTVEQELRSLHRFGYLTDGWDPLIAVLMLRKLDSLTLSIWEMDRDPAKAPSKDDVIRFIEKRILALRNLRATQSTTDRVASQPHNPNWSQHNNHKNRRHDIQLPAQSVVSTSNPFANRCHDNQSSRDAKRPRQSNHDSKPSHTDLRIQPTCPECNKPHFMWFCPAFKSWDLEKRMKEVAKWKLCPCCLIDRHLSSECREKGCPRCNNDKHNNMLCPKSYVYKSNMVVQRSRKIRRSDHRDFA